MKALYNISLLLLLSVNLLVCGCKQETHFVETALKPHVESGNLPGVISVLIDENGEPTHIFCATGDGGKYRFEGRTYIVCMKLEKE